MWDVPTSLGARGRYGEPNPISACRIFFNGISDPSRIFNSQNTALHSLLIRTSVS